MKYVFHPQARIELNNIIDYYEALQARLGLEFLEEVYSTVCRIIEFPKAWSSFSKSTRKCLLNRFPFAIIYRIRKDEILIVAIAHFARKPGYWKNRV